MPDVPDPYAVQSDLNPNVDGTTIYFRVSDWSFAGDVDDGYKWTIGDPAATAFAPARSAGDVDGGIAVYFAGGEESPWQVRASDGVHDVLVAEGGGDVPGRPGDQREHDRLGRVDRLALDIRGVTIDPLTLTLVVPFTVCAGRGQATQPAIDGEVVAWKDSATALGTSTDATSRPRAPRRSAVPPTSRAARASETWIAWVDYRSRRLGADIYARRCPVPRRAPSARRASHRRRSVWGRRLDRLDRLAQQLQPRLRAAEHVDPRLRHACA